MDENLSDSGQCNDQRSRMHDIYTNVWVGDETRVDDTYNNKDYVPTVNYRYI